MTKSNAWMHIDLSACVEDGIARMGLAVAGLWRGYSPRPQHRTPNQRQPPTPASIPAYHQAVVALDPGVEGLSLRSPHKRRVLRTNRPVPGLLLKLIN